MDQVLSFLEEIPDANQRELAMLVHDDLLDWLFPCETAIKWQIPFFMHYGNLCYLNPVPKRELTLGFMRGAALSDPGGLLVARDRKMIRHLPLYSPADWYQPGVRELVLESAALNEQYLKA